MTVRYSREMREQAKRKKLGLLTIGYVLSDGGSWHSQGPATVGDIKIVSDAMYALIKRKGKKKP